jgi:hypothetical protein
MGTNLTDEQRDCVNVLQNSGKHLLSLINDILDFSQIEAGQISISKTEMSIQDSVREVLTILQVEAIRKGLTLTFDTSISKGSKFIGDQERIRQILFNLLGNAIKFTTEGRISIRLSEQDGGNGVPGIKVDVEDTVSLCV